MTLRNREGYVESRDHLDDRATGRILHVRKQATFETAGTGSFLPGAVAGANRVEYQNFALLRETPSRYWVMRVGLATDVFSVAKSQVLYVRY